jgi:hypothetical protein
MREKIDILFIFSHPDFTVGAGISPARLLRVSGLSPPVWNFTTPQRYYSLKASSKSRFHYRISYSKSGISLNFSCFYSS